MQETLTALREFFIHRVDSVTLTYVREQISWFDDHRIRLLGIKGARGVGKSTLVLQYLKRLRLKKEEWLYLSMEHPYFVKHNLLDLISFFYDQGGRLLVLDEVHRFKDWAVNIKLLYDAKPELRIIFTGSSILEITKANADLSRRAIVFELAGLSFREYLSWEGLGNFPAQGLPDLLEYHGDLAWEITQDEKLDLLPAFNAYLSHGYYPFYKEGVTLYSDRLINTVNLLLEQDIPAFYNYTYPTVRKLKLLLQILAESPPFKPNLTKIANRTEQHRQTVLEHFFALQSAGLVALLSTDKKGIVRFQKPDKLFLANPNLASNLTPLPSDKGALREIFFFNQLRGAKLHTTSSDIGDFRCEEFIFEVGGKGKGHRQLRKNPKAFTAVDGILIGSHNRVPLWLFGFLY